MTNSPPRKRSNIVSLITLVIILLTFGYYYFYYIPFKKAQFTEQAFRIIERVGVNVQAKTANYQRIIDNTAKNIPLQYIYKSTAMSDIQRRLVAVDFPKELRLLSVNPYHRDSTLVAGQYIDFVNGKLRFTYVKQKADQFFEAVFEYDGKEFFPNTLRYDFFKEYILFTEKEVVYSDVPLTHEIISDSLNFEGPLRSSSQMTVSIDQKKHQLYLVPVSIDGTTLFIGGLTNQQYFNSITHSLSPYTYTVIAFLIILMVVALPYFKLYFITEKERLNTWDAIFSFLVLLFGSAFVVVMLIYYFQQQGPEVHLRVDFLKNFAQKLENNFKNEIGDIISQIDADEKVLVDQGGEAAFSPWVYDRHMDAKDTLEKNLFSHYANYDAITWINPSGGQIAKWNIHNITARVNTTSRQYFTEVRDGNMFSDTGFSKHPFYLQSIYSMTEGKHYAIVSKKSSIESELDLDRDETKLQGKTDLSPSVVMVATQLQSLSVNELPAHVSYMLIDASGNVLFHRNPRKQLQENFLEETGNNHVLNDCLHGRIPNYFVSTYDTHQKLFYVEPVGNLPIFLVTYLDYEYERLVDVQIFGLTSAMYVGFFLLLILIVALFIYTDYESVKKIKTYNLFFKWFWPNRLKRSLYVLLSGFMVLAFMLFIWGDFFHSVSMSYSFFMLLTISVILCLRQFKNWSEFFVRPAYFIYFASHYSIGFGIFFYSMFAMGISFIWGLLFVALIVACIYLSYQPSKTKQHLQGSKPTINYNIFVFLLIILLGIVPVISFFKRAFDYEKELYIKNIQLNFAEHFNGKPAAEKFRKYQKFETGGDDILHFSASAIEDVPECKKSDENKTPLSVFMQNFRIGSSSSFFTSHQLNEIDNSSERPFFWCKNDGQLQLFARGNPAIKIESDIIRLNARYLFNNKLTPWTLFALFAILLSIFLVIIYRLVIYWTRKIFLLGLLPTISQDLHASLKELKHHTLIISASFSEGVNYLKRYYKGKKHLWVDLTNPSPNITVDNVTEIIELNGLNYIIFADYKPFDKEIISEKIKWIKTILAYNSVHDGHRVRILIVTPYLPVHMESIDDPDEPYMVRKYLETVSGFKKSYYPLGFENKHRLSDDNTKRKIDKKLMQEVLYLPAFELDVYQQFLNKQSKDALMDRNDLILYIQSSEQMLYHSLWNNCTIQEQYLIYDLAQDGLLNSKNLPDIYNLLLKGIMIHKHDRLRLFNHSFQNFVLSVISPRQALEIERASKMEGGWSNLQLPIIMIIFGMLLFLFISQQDIFNYLIGWVTAALGSIPILTRALGGLSTFKLLKPAPKKE